MAWQKNNYSLDEIAKMQREAERRVDEMRRRSSNVTQAANRSMGYGLPAKPDAADRNFKAAPQKTGMQQHSNGISLDGLARSLGLEGDRLIIFLLVMLLMNEQADPKLILALLWIAI